MPKFRSFPLIMLLLMAGLSMTRPGRSAMATEVSHASEILQYVKEDKVYLLEKIRPQLTIPSEKLLVQALLTEDGPQAAALYREQLAKYPDPRLDPISRARLNAYQQAVATSAGLPVMPVKGSSAARKPAVTAGNLPDRSGASAIPPPPPVTEYQPVITQAANTNGPVTLQFGSFNGITNADQLVAQLAPYVSASVQLIDGIYKVRLNRNFNTPQEAEAFGHTLPVESIVVPAQP